MKAGGAAKLIVDALLQRFLPLARRRIETAQAQVLFRGLNPFELLQVHDLCATCFHTCCLVSLLQTFQFASSVSDATLLWFMYGLKN